MKKKFLKYLLWSFIVQTFFFLLGSIALDSGESLFALSYAAVAYWTGVILIKKRRPDFEAKTDHIFMRSGLIILS